MAVCHETVILPFKLNFDFIFKMINNIFFFLDVILMLIGKLLSGNSKNLNDDSSNFLYLISRVFRVYHYTPTECCNISNTQHFPVATQRVVFRI